MNPLRLLFGTLTVLPVRPPTTVDRRVAGRAMTLAPLVGAALAAALALVLALVLGLVLALGGALAAALAAGSGTSAPEESALLLAVLLTGSLALFTRGMHLDGLADVADGLGSGRREQAAVEIMRKSDIGPFGVVTILVVLMLQVTALAQLLGPSSRSGVGVAGLLVALVISRALLPWLCLRAFPPASPTGLGATVAGSVSPAQAVASLLLALGLLGAGLATLTAFAPASPGDLFRVVVAGLLGTVPALGLALRCRSRLGGVTGDVYGAAVETAYTAALVLIALSQ